MSEPHVSPVVSTPESKFSPLSWASVSAAVQDIDICDVVERALAAPRAFPRRSGAQVVFPSDADVPHNTWFVGDIHGDLLAIVNAWHFISAKSIEQGCRPHVVFLGDLIDRGTYSHEVLVFLAWLIANHPGQIEVLVGNHDAALRWNQDTGSFGSDVQPAEYAEALCNRPSLDMKIVGQFAVELFRNSPVGIFFPDGLLAAHAGIPHSDLAPKISTIDDLDEQDYVQDFVWLRLSERSPRKIPNRSNRGCEFGIRDFVEFCNAMSSCGVALSRFVRGHDHHPKRFSILNHQGVPTILTLNTMCHWLEDEFPTAVFPNSFVAKHIVGEIPALYQVPINSIDIEASMSSRAAK